MGDPDGTVTGFGSASLRCEVCLLPQTMQSLHPTRSGFWRCCEHLYGMGFTSSDEFFTWLAYRPKDTPTIWEMRAHFRKRPPVWRWFSFPYREMGPVPWLRRNWL